MGNAIYINKNGLKENSLLFQIDIKIYIDLKQYLYDDLIPVVFSCLYHFLFYLYNYFINSTVRLLFLFAVVYICLIFLHYILDYCHVYNLYLTGVQ